MNPAPLTAAELRSTRFRFARRRGYDVAEVDRFVDRVERALTGQPPLAGETPLTVEQVRSTSFSRPRGPGYRTDEVDAFLERVAGSMGAATASGTTGPTSGPAEHGPGFPPESPPGTVQQAGPGTLDHSAKGKVLDRVRSKLSGAEVSAAVAGSWRGDRGVLFLSQWLLAFEPELSTLQSTVLPLDRLSGWQRPAPDVLVLHFDQLPAFELTGTDAEVDTFLGWLDRIRPRG